MIDRERQKILTEAKHTCDCCGVVIPPTEDARTMRDSLIITRIETRARVVCFTCLKNLIYNQQELF